jgi:hypothetical protein
MAAPLYIAWNGDTSALTAAPTAVSTGTTLKTMLQIKPGTPKIRIVEWGYSFDVLPTAVVKVELITTGTVFATVTSIGSGVLKYNDVTGPASQVVTGTTATGFTSTAEGTVTSSRLIAYQHEWGNQFKQQFPLGREPEVDGSSALRIRATTATAVNMSCYVIWEE